MGKEDSHKVTGSLPIDEDRSTREVLISVCIPEWMLEELDRLVQEGKFPNRGEAIRRAIRDLLLREHEHSSPITSSASMRVSGEYNENNVIEVKGKDIIIKSLKPGLYKVRYLEEELVIEITRDGELIIYEILTDEDIKKLLEKAIEKQK